MDRFLDFVVVVACWVGTGLLIHMGYELGEYPALLIVFIIIMVFFSLLITIYTFAPSSVHRFLFGGDDRKWW